MLNNDIILAFFGCIGFASGAVFWLLLLWFCFGRGH